jgi:hypothetical protein
VGIWEGKEKCRSIWSNSGWEFSKFSIHDRHQSTDSGSSEKPSKINAKRYSPRHIIFKIQKNKEKEKILKEAQRTKTPYLEKQGKELH